MPADDAGLREQARNTSSSCRGSSGEAVTSLDYIARRTAWRSSGCRIQLPVSSSVAVAPLKPRSAVPSGAPGASSAWEPAERYSAISKPAARKDLFAEDSDL